MASWISWELSSKVILSVGEHSLGLKEAGELTLAQKWGSPVIGRRAPLQIGEVCRNGETNQGVSDQVLISYLHIAERYT